MFRRAGMATASRLRMASRGDGFDRTFGKFPATVPSLWCITYLQAGHLDLEFYDRYFEPGAYLDTHARLARRMTARFCA
jgi:hypothetical protein